MAAGASRGWRRAALLASYDGGTSWISAGSTSASATMGYALHTAAPGGPALFDERTSIEVELLNDGMWLESRNDQALANGANLAIVGQELIQFGTAQPIAPRRFRLSHLLRGRRGTDWAAFHHEAGEPFALLEPETMTPLDRTAARPGAEIRLLAQGIGDHAEPPPLTLIVRGDALAPPSPVHLNARSLPTGEILIDWVRRSRTGWSWSGEIETPLGEETERYQIRLHGTGFDRRVAVSEPEYVYTAEQQAADNHSGELRIEVSQTGTHAASRAATLNFLNIGNPQ
jgi:hypothetical protein